jgi:hypothetical protein
MEGIDIRFGVDRHRLDAELAAGTDDLEGDFATVGYQDFRKHRGRVSE